MKLRQPYHLPEGKRKKLKKAVRLEWITIFCLLSITVVMFVTMGSSQAMKSAWIEDVLSLIPPITFLIAIRYRDRAPNANYPYGYQRATLLAFLAASVAVCVLGLYMLYDSSKALITQDHPSIGHFSIASTNWEIWSGWVMIGALIYSMIPPVILGRIKLRLASDLHEKTLHADADMNKADWMTAGAAIIGILGIGAGLWWADAVAAGFISFEVLKDGFTNTKQAMRDLMDHVPTAVSSGKPLALADHLKDEVQRLPGVLDADIRLREEGHIISGEIFVVLAEQNDVAVQLQHISEHAVRLDWRLYELIVMPVTKV